MLEPPKKKGMGEGLIAYPRKIPNQYKLLKSGSNVNPIKKACPASGGKPGGTSNLERSLA